MEAEKAAESEAASGGDPAGWGPLTLYLGKREYTYSVTYGTPPTFAREQFRGKLEFRDGHWVALPPKSESIGCSW